MYAWDGEANADEGRGWLFRSIEQKGVSGVLVSQFINGPFNVANFNSLCVPLSDYPLCHPISYPPEANPLTLHRRDSVCMCVFREEWVSVGNESVWQLWQRVTEEEMFYYKQCWKHHAAPNICARKTYLRALVSQPICKEIDFFYAVTHQFNNICEIYYICEEINSFSVFTTLHTFPSIFSTAKISFS